jgi:ribose transport system substrate-binding protein
MVAGLCTALTGCGRDEPSPADSTASDHTPATTGPLRIAVIPKATNHEFWKAVHAGALKAEAELPAVQIIWQGAAREDDRSAQINVVEDFINAKVSGIVLAPLDSQALIRPAHEAMQAGIPVVIMDSGLDGEPGRDYVSFVATDNRAGGRDAARRLGHVLGGKGRVLVLRYLQGSDSTHNREEGFLAELARRYPDIQVVSSDQYAGATTDEAFDRAQALLDRFPDLDGVFAPCEPVVLGLLLAMQEAGRLGEIKLVGFDTSDKLVEALEQDHLQGLVLQDPMEIGYRAVKTLVDHLRGQNVPTRIDTPSLVATPGNMDEPRVRELLDPPIEKYGL